MGLSPVSMLVTIAIPAFNRPALLLDGLRSVVRQTYPDWEVVVIDDGSSPPINAQDIHGVVGDRFKLIRHSSSQGVVAAKNAGIRHAGGDIIMHLDDDDLLAPETLEKAVCALQAHPELDGVYLNVEPFGKLAEGTRRNQERALDTILRAAKASEDQDMVYFDDRLFGALLKTVPMPFQRPVARREAWVSIGETPAELYYGEPDWALRAALFCNFALLKQPLAKWRVDGQNFASQAANRQKHSMNGIQIKQHIYALTITLPPDKSRYSSLAREGLAQAYFNHAYLLCDTGARMDSVKYLARAARVFPRLKQIKLLLKLLTPLACRSTSDR